MLNIASHRAASSAQEDTRKTWREMLIDSAIIGAISVFAVIGSEPPTWNTVWIAFKAFGAAFVIQLAVERGLKKWTPNNT
jgi:hypothetical protein